MKKLLRIFTAPNRRVKRILFVSLLILSTTLSASSQTSEVTLPLLEEIRTLRESFFLPEELISLTLNQATKTGALQNFDIQIAGTDWEKAKAEILKSKSRYDLNFNANWMTHHDFAEQPSVVFGNSVKSRPFEVGLKTKLPTGTDIEYSYEMEWRRSNSLFATFIPTYTGKQTITLKQALLQNFLGMVDRAEVNITKLGADIEKDEFFEITEEEIFKIRRAYWELAFSMENFRAVVELLEISEKLVAVGQRKFTMATIEKPDYLNLMSLARKRAEELLFAENEIRLKSNELAFLIGIDVGLVYFAGDPMIPGTDLPDFDIQLDSAFEHRALFKKAGRLIRQAGLNVKRTSNLRLPDLSASVSYATNGLDSQLKPSIHETFSKTNPTYFLGFEITYPLLNMEARANYRQAKEEQKRAEVEFKKTVSQINQEINNAYSILRSHLERWKQTQKIVELDKDKFFAEKGQFQVGRSNTERLTSFQDDWLRSRILDARTRRNVLIARDGLSRARGTLLKDVGLAGEEK